MATEAVSPPEKMSFLEHLDELRRRLLWSIVGLAVAFLACFSVTDYIYAFLMGPITSVLPEEGQLIATAVPEIFMLHLKMAFFASIFLAAPIWLSQVWMFIAPGLYKKEKKFAVPFILFGTIFFLAGAAFAHYVVFPYASKFLTGYGDQQIQVLLNVDGVFKFYSRFILGMGLVFQIPTAVFVLSRIGLVTPRFLVKQFKYAVLLIFILAAIITPTPDVITQSMLALPMIGLYVFSIGVSWFFGKDRRVDEENS